MFSYSMKMIGIDQFQADWLIDSIQIKSNYKCNFMHQTPRYFHVDVAYETEQHQMIDSGNRMSI